MPMPASGRHGRVRLAPHGAAVGIGPRRVLLWSTLVVSNHGLRSFVPEPSNDVDEQGCAYLGWEVRGSGKTPKVALWPGSLTRWQ
jgi:hypothetical protein